jgi:hypothetical protein
MSSSRSSRWERSGSWLRGDLFGASTPTAKVEGPGCRLPLHFSLLRGHERRECLIGQFECQNTPLLSLPPFLPNILTCSAEQKTLKRTDSNLSSTSGHPTHRRRICEDLAPPQPPRRRFQEESQRGLEMRRTGRGRPRRGKKTKKKRQQRAVGKRRRRRNRCCSRWPASSLCEVRGGEGCALTSNNKPNDLFRLETGEPRVELARRDGNRTCPRSLGWGT